MWRALFLAIGIVLIVLGVETLVVGRFAIANEGRVQKALTKLFGDDPNPGSLVQSNGGFASADVAPPQYTNYNAYGGSIGQSRYGQSRFTNGSNDQFFNPGLNASPSAPSNRGFSLAGFGQSNRALNSQGVRMPGSTARIVRTKEWMPWSLVAVGIVVVLYTHSLTRSDFGSGD